MPTESATKPFVPVPEDMLTEDLAQCADPLHLDVQRALSGEFAALIGARHGRFIRLQSGTELALGCGHVLSVRRLVDQRQSVASHNTSS